MFSGFVGGGAGAADVTWKMRRIMLQFRPIAPKPAVPRSGTVGGAVEVAAGGALGGSCKRKSGGSVGRGRGQKKKKVEVAKQKKSSSPSSSSSLLSTSSTVGSDSSSSIATLSLMPETPDRKESLVAPLPTLQVVLPYVAPLTCLHRPEAGASEASVVVTPRPMCPAGSWVTVEGITETWCSGEVGGADRAVWKAMEADACPAFVTDYCDRVTWTNEAYRKMFVCAQEEEDEDDEEIRVGLVTRGMLPEACTCRAFTCWVRVEYACRRRGKVSLAAPCDVWRLDSGGWAWRIDVKFALSLSFRVIDD